MNNKNTTLEEYCRIKVDIECVFLFLLNFKTKYTYGFPTSTSQIVIVNHGLLKTLKSTPFNLNIKIVIAIVTQYKMQIPVLGFSQLIGVNIRRTTILELGRCH